jgi:hypothetical protein
LDIVARVVGRMAVPRKRMDPQAVACGNVRESYGMAPKPTKVQVVEVLFSVPEGPKLTYKELIILACETEWRR